MKELIESNKNSDEIVRELTERFQDEIFEVMDTVAERHADRVLNGHGEGDAQVLTIEINNQGMIIRANHRSMEPTEVSSAIIFEYTGSGEPDGEVYAETNIAMGPDEFEDWLEENLKNIKRQV